MIKTSKIDDLLIQAIINTVKNSSICNSFNNTYKKQKYQLNDILPVILLILKNGYAWRFNEYLKINIHWNTIYKVFKKLSDNNIFKNNYISTLKKYIKKGKKNTLKFIHSDTSFIYNRYNSDIVKRNSYCKNKNVVKLSIISNSEGIPLNAKLYSGNINDAKILNDHLDDDLYTDNNNKKYFLADKGYER